METTTTTIEPTITTTTTEKTPDPGVTEALAALGTMDVDALPTVRIRAAYRNLSCSGSGPECYRRLRYPHQHAGTEWPDAPRLPAASHLAADRRATVHCEIPIGTIVVDYEREVYRGKRGRCSVTIGLVIRDPEGAGKILWLKHRTLRARPVYEAALPDGRKIEIERRDV